MSRRIKHGKDISRQSVMRRISSNRLSYPLLFLILGLSIFGVIMVYDASVAVALARYNEPYYFVTQQIRNLVIGLVGLVVLTQIDYRFWKKYAGLVLLAGLALLLAVHIPGLGQEQGGARSWLGVGPLTFQPSYLLVVALIMYLASWLTREDKERETWRNGFMPFFVLLGFIILVVAGFQGDLGTGAIIASVCLIMYFISGAPLAHLLVFAPIGAIAGAAFVLTQPYRMGRIMTMLSGGDGGDLEQGWQISQILIALGSGGWTGLGLGQSRQKYEYIPVVESDSIFAVIGEEFGFLGATMVVAALFALIWYGLNLSRSIKDPFGQLLVVGVISLVAIQTLVNLLGVASLIPFTGVPLPFISSGGTSLVVLLCAMGLVLSVSKHGERVGEKGKG